MSVRTWRRGSAAIAGAIGMTLALGACGDDEGGAASDVDCSVYSAYGTFDDAEVDVYASIRDVEAERFTEAFAPFEECTGIKIKWEGSAEFEAQLPVRVQGGSPPDLAPIPQPGLLAQLVGAGAIKEASAKVKAQAEENFSEDWLSYGTIDGKFYAPPLGANVKSFVWYSPSMFEDNGWEIPKTWAALKTLTETIAASGDDLKPWCAGIGSGEATGWPATDWLEDVMLRTAGPEVYDQWYKHEIPFNDPKVVTALDEVGSILKNPKYVNGGYGDVDSIATTSFNEGGLPILEGQCAMHRQASFYANQWPKGTQVAEDGDVFAFYLPTDDTEIQPVEAGGEFIAAFNTEPATEAVQLFMTSTEFANAKAKLGDWISANKNLEVENVVNPIDKSSVQLLQDPSTVIRFDASDLMPGAVGANSFWKQITAWITGQSTSVTLANIEKSWPKS